MKATGAEIEAFYGAWPIVPSDFYHDDGYQTDDDGKFNLVPDKLYDVEEVIGYLVWQGEGDCPKSVTVNKVVIAIPPNWTGPDAVSVFKAWRGDKQTHRVFLKPDQVDQFKTLCSEHDWEIL